VGFMFGQYKRLRNEWVGILTGKGCELTQHITLNVARHD